LKDQISSGENTQGLVPAPWEMFENALDRKERRGKSFIWYSIAAGVLLVFSAVITWISVADKSVKKTAPVVAKEVEAPKTSVTDEQINEKEQAPASQQNPVAGQSLAIEQPNAADKEITKTQKELTNPSVATQSSAGVAQTETSASTTPKIHSSASNTPKSVSTSKSGIENEITVASKEIAPTSKAINKTDVQLPPAVVEIVPVSVAEVQNSSNSGMAWMLDAAGFEIQAVEFVSDFSLAQKDLAKLNKEFESSELSQGSLSDLAHAMDLGKWWMEVSADQNQTGLTYRTPNDLSQYVHKNYTEQMRNGESALSAARFQLAVNMFISKNSSVKVGIAYAQNKVGQSFNFRDSMPAVVSAGQSPDAYGNYPIFGYLGLGPEVKYNGVVNYSFLSVPIGWTGYLPIGQSKSLFFTPEAVLQPNWIQLSTGAQTLDYQTLLLKPMDAVNYRAWVMSARVAAGIQKRLSYKHAIGAKLNAQGVLNSMNTANSPVQTRGWSSGVTLYYSFKID